MTEQKPDVPAEGTEEVLTPPTPEISAASEQASSEQAKFDAEAFEKRFKQLEESLLERLPEEVDRRFKSTTDKSFQDVRKVAKYLDQFGGDVEKAVREMAIDEIIEERRTVDPGRSDSPSGQVPSDFKKRTAEILEEAGIPLDDPEVVALSKEKVADAADWYRKLTRLGVRRAKQGGVTESASVSPTGQPAPTSSDDDLLNKIQELLRHPVKNAAEIDRLSSEARKRGLLK